VASKGSWQHQNGKHSASAQIGMLVSAELLLFDWIALPLSTGEYISPCRPFTPIAQRDEVQEKQNGPAWKTVASHWRGLCMFRRLS